MFNKTKTTLSVVGLIAVFSVYKFSGYIHQLALSGPKLEANLSSLGEPGDDSDQDGLTNPEEIMWGTDPLNPDSDQDGFLDGEEAATGHSPLVPGPKDLLSEENLTEKASSLALSGLTAGDLKPESPNYAKSLADITDAVADSSNYIFNTKINPDNIRVNPSNEKADIEYIKNIAPIMRQFFSLLNDQYSILESTFNTIGKSGFTSDVKNTFHAKSKSYESISQKTLDQTLYFIC